MKFTSPLISQGSGSLAGLTFSRNRGGKYIRARATPTNPNTVFQQAVRGFMSQLTSLWNDTLTQAERDAWDLYAENVLIPDTLGEPRNVGGLGMYNRTNVPALQAGLARVDAAPTVFNIGDFTNPSIVSITAATNILSLAFTAADAWANETGSAMLVYTSRAQNPTINFFKGPYRLAGAILGDDTTAPTSPAAITLAFNAEVGQRIFIKVNVIRLDGRYAATFRDNGLGG